MKCKFSFLWILILFCSMNCFKCDEPCTYTNLDTNIKDVKNSAFLGKSYNIFIGNPNAKEDKDLGWKYEIFEFGSNKEISSDRMWLLPKGMSYSSMQMCNAQFSSRSITSMQNYFASLQKSVSVKGQIVAGQFSASNEYRNMMSKIKDQQIHTIESTAQCFVSDISLTNKVYIKSQVLKDLLKIKKDINNKQAYYSFFETYGTHVSSRVKLGSKLIYLYEMSKQNANSILEDGNNLEMSASAKSNSMSGSVMYSKDEEKRFNTTLSDDIATLSIINIGSPIPKLSSDATAQQLISEWMNQTISSPGPVEFELTSFSDILQKFNFKDYEIMTPNDVTQIAQKMELHMSNYCIDYLQKNDPGITCSIPNIFLQEDKTSPLAYFARSKIPIKLSQAGGEIQTNFYVKNQNVYAISEQENVLVTLMSPSQPKQEVTVQTYMLTDSSLQYFYLKKMSRYFERYQLKSKVYGTCIQVQNPGAQNSSYVLAPCSDVIDQQFTMRFNQVRNQKSQNAISVTITHANEYSSNPSSNGKQAALGMCSGYFKDKTRKLFAGDSCSPGWQIEPIASL